MNQSFRSSNAVRRHRERHEGMLVSSVDIIASIRRKMIPRCLDKRRHLCCTQVRIVEWSSRIPGRYPTSCSPVGSIGFTLGLRLTPCLYRRPRRYSRLRHCFCTFNICQSACNDSIRIIILKVTLLWLRKSYLCALMLLRCLAYRYLPSTLPHI